MASVVRLAVAAAFAVTGILSCEFSAQAQNVLRLHEAIPAAQRPLLCADRDSVNLIIPVLARAADARVAREADKSQRLAEIATRLQGEVCRKSAPEDVVILRCKLGQVDTGGAQVVLVKVSALMQAEAAKGEQAFYAWTDARVEDGSAPGTQEAATRWCGAERVARAIQVAPREDSAPPAQANVPVSNEPFNATPDILLRVQQRLYDFGLRIEQLNGQLNNETANNLAQFQKYVSLPANGQLTRSTIEKLMTTPAPTPWVTIAFDGYGNFAAELGRTRRDTEMAAIERIQRRSGRDFKLSSVAAPSCLGFAVTRYSERGRRSRTNFTQAFTSAGDSIEAAARNAWDYCEREKGGGECNVRYALCADGSGGGGGAPGPSSRFDPGGVPANSPNPRVDPTSLPTNAPAPKFDPGSLPLNSPAPQEQPSGPSSRFDPGGTPTNAPAPRSRFDPNSLPENAPAPRSRFDPKFPAANSPNPNAR